jgi:RNA polymerase sigma factor (TIGR02999 family)
MTTPSSQDVTWLLLAWRNGDREALERLTPLVYGELRRMAHRFMRRERPDHTLQSSALVNEAYIRMIDCHQVEWQNRAHFFGIAAQMMRQILIDHARRHARARRGGGLRQVSFEETAVVSVERAAELIALDDALNDLLQRGGPSPAESRRQADGGHAGEPEPAGYGERRAEDSP